MQRCKDVIGKIQQIVAYVFSSAEGSDEGAGWTRKEVCKVLLNASKGSSTPATSTATGTSTPAIGTLHFPLPTLLINTITSAIRTDSFRDCCVFREVFSRVLSFSLGSSGMGIDEEEANLWLQYARTLVEGQVRAPLTGITILSTLVANLPSSSATSTSTTISSFATLNRYRNSLASSLLSIPSSKAPSEGARILSTLVLGTAPDAVESGEEFLPVQRAVNVAKVCQRWVEEGGEGEGEGDAMEELESIMTLTFFHLAPILQNVPGGHWQFIFDVVENNIENCDFKFIATKSSSYASTSTPSPLQLLTLARTLRLIAHIHDLAATNKALRTEWSERRGGIMRGVRDLLTDGSEGEEESSASSSSNPRSELSVPENVCRELALELVANYLPDELIDYEVFPKMCHLLYSNPSSSTTIRHPQLAYQILHKAAKRRTEYFVLEAGVDTEGKVEPRLPKELMVLLQREVNLDLELGEARGDGSREQNIFVYLLGWMLLFDLFADTSVKVRMSYIEQLRSSGIIEAHFIPNMFALLSLDNGIVKAFKLDMWAVDEFYVQFYEPGSFSGITTLAAHLYYRALLTVPSLIHSWVLDCRDRQLSSTIATYTSAHFSPVLIRAELDHVKRSTEGQSELAPSNSGEDDSNQLTVKVASGAVNEVTALYSVDEQQLEIRLRIPSDWPLHRVEIRDTKKIGVDDNRWRAWILGVQQTIWAQNGRIVDGLALFKKNVTLHFAGQVECAICYSIISVMDGSLPKKPCNTCKNRFHAGCLFKWFNSSHSSSCPLCRSDILH
ncbi:hypothetical protein BT96DRAFT_999800 [Gymnopus androsaceus JB14]|uniref:E3 ubiquitin-protein ligase listerin n=1 Tax=Gymnopus androsaceus JB14 TaxID=1447944 RepID=A0A6A4H5U7_9AGAR|nr:hypothetical protein BT96DRAFT_999800 [Gymnopus androsaceus JB14]